MATVVFDKGIKRVLNGGIVLDGSTHTIKAVLIDENDVTPIDTMEFYSELSAGAVGTPVDISSNLSLDATSGEIRCAPFETGIFSGDPTESVLFFSDTGTPSTSPLIAKVDAAIVPNGAANWTVTLTGNKLLGATATNFFHRTFGKIASGATALDGGATLKAQLLTAAPAYTEEFMSEVSNTTGAAVTISSFSILDAKAAILPGAATVFSSITATVTHAVLFLDTGNSATDLPIGTVVVSPAAVLTASDFTLSYPGTGALEYAAA